MDGDRLTMSLGEDGIAGAEGMEDLRGDVGGRVAGEEDHERSHAVRVTLRSHRLLARPLARLFEGLLSARRGVDHSGGAARHDGMGAVTLYFAMAFAVDHMSPMMPALPAA